MATYTKETALYDTGAIADDIGQAGETASKYITAVDQNGIKVHAENNTNVNYTVINAEGMEVYDDSASVAKFGAVTRIGTEDDASITIAESRIIGVGAGGKEFFNFADSDVEMETNYGRIFPLVYGNLNLWPHTADDAFIYDINHNPTRISVSYRYWDSNGIASNEFYISGYSFGTAKNGQVTFTVNGESYTLYVSYDGAHRFSNIRLNRQSTDAICKLFVYIRTTTSAPAPAYRIGGAVTANGGYSFAEGYKTVAGGNFSHAEGNETKATGIYSHSEGCLTKASGYGSHAQNEGTIAEGLDQTAIGRYNKPMTNVAFIIGNGTGTGDEDRSNALTVDWNGNINIASGGKYKINGNNLSASDVGAVPTTRTVNGKALSSNVADADYVIDAGTSGSWTYRKWNSGKVEAWCGYSFASAASTVWASPIRYWDKTINIPSEIFSVAPRLMVSAQSNQYWVGGASASSATAGTVRVLTVATSSMAVNLSIYAVSG